MSKASIYGLCRKMLYKNSTQTRRILLKPIFKTNKTTSSSVNTSSCHQQFFKSKTNLSLIPKRYHETVSAPQTQDQAVNITYIGRDGEKHEIKGKVGDNVMYLAQHHDLDVEGACEASLACCTCHVYVEGDYFDKLGELDEEEEDMLDLAPFLQENSRLSCQIILSKELDGIVVRLPSATRNFYVDGHKPQPH